MPRPKATEKGIFFQIFTRGSAKTRFSQKAALSVSYYKRQRPVSGQLKGVYFTLVSKRKSAVVNI